MEVTSFDRKSPGSGCRRPKAGVYCTFHFLQGCSLQEEAVTWQEMMSRDLRWPELTGKWRHLSRSRLEVALEGRKLVHTVCLTSYKAVARRRRHSRDRKWRHVTSGDRKWSGSDVIWAEVTWKWLTRSKTGIYCTFHFLQSCSSQGGSHMTVNDVTWPQVTGNDPEVT